LLRSVDRKAVIVQDEVEASSGATVWWFMHTPLAKITLSTDKKTATITNSAGKKLWLRIQDPVGANFLVQDARPLPSSPDPNGQNPNTGIKKLVIRMGSVTNVRLVVYAKPLRSGESPPASLPSVRSLSSW
jgi:hypothetical protein